MFLIPIPDRQNRDASDSSFLTSAGRTHKISSDFNIRKYFPKLKPILHSASAHSRKIMKRNSMNYDVSARKLTALHTRDTRKLAENELSPQKSIFYEIESRRVYIQWWVVIPEILGNSTLLYPG